MTSEGRTPSPEKGPSRKAVEVIRDFWLHAEVEPGAGPLRWAEQLIEALVAEGYTIIPDEYHRRLLEASRSVRIDPDLGGGPMGLPMSPPERFGDS